MLQRFAQSILFLSDFLKVPQFSPNFGITYFHYVHSMITGFLCRVLTPETVLLALHDRAQQTTVTHEDRLTVTGYKFYCTVRANHFVNLGTWYYEAKVVDIPEGAAARIGYACIYQNLSRHSF